MQADFDMNSNDILNVDKLYLSGLYIDGQPVAVGTLNYNGVIKETQVATSGQTVFNLTTMVYNPGINSLSVYVDGVYQNPSTYTENNNTRITFSVGLHVGAIVDFVALSINEITGAADASSVTYTPLQSLYGSSTITVKSALDQISNQGTGSSKVGFLQSGTGATNRTVQSKLRETVSVKDFGAVGDGVTDDTAAIQAAIDSGVKQIHIPAGAYKITSGANAYGLRITITDLMVTGDGAENTTLVYTSSAINQPGLLVIANGVYLDGFAIDGSANATNAGTLAASGCVDIAIEDVNDCQVSNCKVIGGHYGIHLDNNILNYSVNKNNRIINCVSRNTASSGFHLTQASFALVQGCDAKEAGTDGFKSSGDTYRTRIIGNTASNCTRDGFDLYDGFIECVLADNIADSNTYQGYEIKGTFDGSNYVIRDSVFSNNIAVNNGYPGFTIASVRNCAFTGNQAVSNQQDGFLLSTIQGCTFTGNVASKNIQHGFNLAVSVSRTQFVGCYAVDNSWVNGTTQNGTYHGFLIASGCAGQFTGCSSINGTTTGQVGGQGYGWYWTALSTGSRIVNCYTINNVTGGIGGPAGFAVNQGLLNFTNNGTFKGIQYTDDTLLSLQCVGAFNPSVDATYDVGLTGTRWRKGFFRNGIEVTTPDGLAKYVISVDNAGALTSTLVP
jgi:parallel beta-helix repeat protein